MLKSDFVYLIKVFAASTSAASMLEIAAIIAPTARDLSNILVPDAVTTKFGIRKT